MELSKLCVTYPDPLLLQPVSFTFTWNRYILGRNQYHVYSIRASMLDASMIGCIGDRNHFIHSQERWMIEVLLSVVQSGIK